MTLEIVPVTLTAAKTFVNVHHQHNDAPLSWKFGVGLAIGDELVGIAMVGRPSGRGIDLPRNVEITRVCLNEAGIHKNGASMLYGAACRMAKAGGYLIAYTYTLQEEDATSVKASGFIIDAELVARESWSSPSRPRYEETLLGPRDRPTGSKYRWRRDL